MNKADDRILSLEDKVENLDQISKEMTNLRKHRKRTMQKIWNTIKRLNLWIIDIDEGQKSQVNDTDQIFKTIIYKKHTEPQLDETRKETPHGISQSKH